MKNAVLIAFVIVSVALVAVISYAAPGQDKKYGGFDITTSHTGPGAGAFTITGENAYGSVNVSCTYQLFKSPDIGRQYVSVIFDAGSVVTCADEMVYDLSGHELTYAADASISKIIHTVINYIKTFLEG